MSEFVIECWYDIDDGWIAEEYREEIVRCRDCRHYRERVNGCVEFGDESRGEYAKVEPDGFCAWGERRSE